jgi:hypothetical protein
MSYWAARYWAPTYWTPTYWGAVPAAGGVAPTLDLTAIVTLELAARFLPRHAFGGGRAVWTLPSRWRAELDLLAIVRLSLPARHVDYVRDVLIPEDDELLLLVGLRDAADDDAEDDLRALEDELLAALAFREDLRDDLLTFVRRLEAERRARERR